MIWHRWKFVGNVKQVFEVLQVNLGKIDYRLEKSASARVGERSSSASEVLAKRVYFIIFPQLSLNTICRITVDKIKSENIIVCDYTHTAISFVLIKRTFKRRKFRENCCDNLTI